MYNPYSLEGKTILITGASSGIGQATAIECSKMGAEVILTARNEERLKETLRQLEGNGHQYIVADLSKIEDIEQLITSIPIVNGCVNNAGYNTLQLIPFIKIESVKDIFQTNIIAPIFLTHLLVKRKKISNNSSIVFTSSISGKGVSTPGNSLYSSTKGVLSAFMQNAAVELAPKKIRCNAVLPGMVETPLKEGKTAVADEQWEINRQLYPLKRFGTPQDIAFAIIYLLSDASSWVTGTELVIDGGRSLY